MSIAPTVDAPDWVATRAAAWNQLISGTVGELNLGSSSGGRTFNFPRMTSGEVVNQLNRINNALGLVPDTGSSALSGTPTNVPQAQFVADPDAFVNFDDQNRRIPTPGTVPNPGSTLETAPAPAVPTPVNPLNEPPIQVPATQPSTPSGPATSLLDMPNTGGRPEGSTWDGKMLDGRPVKYFIPQGNGSNTVDLEITNPNGTIDRWRIASDGHGGLQHWHDDADGNSSYASRTDPNSNWYVQSFDPGASTSAAPSHDLEATATFSHVFTPSFDANGNRVGTDVGILNQFGFYDNNHVDNYGNLTMTTARPDGKGGVTSSFVKQLDSNSWRFGSDGQIWEMGTDLRGHTTYGRTESDDEGTHSFLISDNVLYDSFYGRNGGRGSHTDQYNFDGTITRTIPNGPKLLIRRDGTHTVLRDAPGGYDSVTKALMTGWDVLKGMGSSLKTWGTDLISTFDFRPGLLAAGNPTNQAYQAAAAEHFERTNAAIQAPFYLLIIDPAETVAKAVYYKYSGAMLGLTGDPITPGGRIRAQQGIDQMNKAPSDIETLLAASTFFFPESAAARAGATTALRGADLALADLAATAARKPLTQLSTSTMWSGTNALKFEVMPATRSGFGVAEIPTKAGMDRWLPSSFSDMPAAIVPKSGSNVSLVQVISSKYGLTAFDRNASIAHQGLQLDRALRLGDDISRSSEKLVVQTEQYLQLQIGHSPVAASVHSGAGGGFGAAGAPARVGSSSVSRSSGASSASPGRGTSATGGRPPSPPRGSSGGGGGAVSGGPSGPVPNPAFKRAPTGSVDVTLPDGRVLKAGEYKVVVKGQGDVKYYSDSKGRPDVAVAELEPPPPGRPKVGVSGKPYPLGWLRGIDNRGHMVPEIGVKNEKWANVNENLFAQHVKANQPGKRDWEDAAVAWARKHPGTKMQATVLTRYRSGRPRLTEYRLYDKDWNEIPGFHLKLDNPTSLSRYFITTPRNPVWPTP
ncbi:hypothetical protein [Nocardia sp. NPDC056100]|uniref:hypothetical protein n=1 Tax=Nocardia sp. NPDC056100 TaxID=3345712 RepID=UPI0035E37C5F